MCRADRDLRAPALVRAQVSLLRFQLARPPGQHSGGRICRGPPRGSRRRPRSRRRAAKVGSVFLGGGTPSLFSVRAIATLIEGLAARLSFATDVEITMEANPGTIEHGRFAGYAKAGVNRVSLGAQSFDAEALKALGRIHGPGEIGAAVAELARRRHRELQPRPDVRAAPADARGRARRPRGRACARPRAPLALPADARAGHGLPSPPAPAAGRRPRLRDAAATARRASHPRASTQYEVSAYARPGRQCRHNLNYWRFGDYLGIGAGAHGKATVGGAVIRTEKPRSPREYLAGGGRVGATGAAGTRCRTALRVHAECASSRRGLQPRRIRAHDRPFGRGRAAQSWATLRHGASWRPERGRYRASELGFRFLNDLLAGFLPEENARRRPGELYTAPSRFVSDRDFGHFVSEMP